MAKKSELSPTDYVHLHNHTQYSLLDGLTKVPALLDYVKENGMAAVAMTDHGTLSGTVEFYKEATSRSIKPIIGMEAYVAPGKYTGRDPAKDKAYYHLIVLAKDSTGYRNLMQLSTLANLKGFYYKPRIDHDLLKQYSEGLIILSGCIGGELGEQLDQNQYDKARDIAVWYKKVFKDRYYLELQDHGHEDHPHRWDRQFAVNKQLLKLGKELDIPCVVTCDAHYLRHEDQEAHEVLLCVQTGSFLSDTKRMSLKEFELHVTPPSEVIGRWGRNHPDLILNTSRIAAQCDVKLDLGKILIPKFPVPNGETEKTFLQKLVYRGLAWRYSGLDKETASKLDIEAARSAVTAGILQRAEYELGVVDSMGFNGYFLIIADFIGWGKRQGIVFGPGRGSAAGSIISYALNITELDPLAYDLLFERFLNPDRISMPDIDIDIQDTRRDEVIQYCVDKYGKDRVANIVTFGKMAARNAIRDVARVLQVPYGEADRLAKMIPPPAQGRHIPLATSLLENQDLKKEYETNEQAKRVFDLAVQLEGTIRSHGVHAAGVVIAPDEIVKFVPLEMAQKGVVTTQYSMGPIEDLGLLKMDFLGLSNLTIIKNTLRIIKKVYGTEIDVATLPLDDKKTFKLFQNGDTTGVFQFESAGMKRYLKELRPTVFDDLIAMNALYRPGPMQWIGDFIDRKHGKKATEYLHEKTRNALENTYGILVYQEQVMQIAKDLCGFTGGQADTLRKGVAKKKPEVLAALKKDFISGAMKNSDISHSRIEEFWLSLEAFAAYCFPKAHSSCYATIAYWTAYLKANYPAAFMAALMTSDFDDTDRLAIEISECKHMGIEVLPPDINESYGEFAIVPGANQIRFGMNAIKNVGTGAVEEIVRTRTEAEVFENIEDFLSRVSSRLVNRKTMESLIKAGAFDRFGERGILLFNLDSLLAYASRLQKEQASGQTDLFGEQSVEVISRPTLQLDPTNPYQSNEQLVWERELLGIYLSQHPLDSYETFLSEKTVPLNSLKPEHDGKMAVIGGTIVDCREISTKSGQKMAFVKLADRFGEIELVIFPNLYQQTEKIWKRDKIVIAKGRLSSKDRLGKSAEEVKCMPEDAREIGLDEAQDYQSTGKKVKAPRPPKAVAATAKLAPALTQSVQKRVYIRLDSGQNQDLLVRLKQTIDECTGSTEVVLVLGASQQRQIIKLPIRMNEEEPNLLRLQALVGADNVVFK